MQTFLEHLSEETYADKFERMGVKDAITHFDKLQKQRKDKIRNNPYGGVSQTMFIDKEIYALMSWLRKKGQSPDPSVHGWSWRPGAPVTEASIKSEYADKFERMGVSGRAAHLEKLMKQRKDLIAQHGGHPGSLLIPIDKELYALADWLANKGKGLKDGVEMESPFFIYKKK